MADKFYPRTAREFQLAGKVRYPGLPRVHDAHQD